MQGFRRRPQALHQSYNLTHAVASHADCRPHAGCAWRIRAPVHKMLHVIQDSQSQKVHGQATKLTQVQAEALEGHCSVLSGQLGVGGKERSNSVQCCVLARDASLCFAGQLPGWPQQDAPA